MQKRFYTFLLTMIIILGSFFKLSHSSLAATGKGDGSAETPYLIKTIDDLYKITDDPTAHYKIMNDLDFNHSKHQPMAEFNGVLDGDGHDIQNLTIVNDNFRVGLFSVIEEATIKNLNIKNLSIENPKSQIGAFAGYSKNSNYINCSLSNSYIMSPNTQVGGFSGYSDNSTYNKCNSIDNIIIGNWYVGGLIGESNTNSILFQCYSTSSVEGAGAYVSGLIGGVSKEVRIKECFSTGDIKGTDYIGGLIGYNNMSASIIENSYSICNLSGTASSSNVGGLIGYVNNSDAINYTPSIQNCYFAGGLSGKVKSGLSPSGTITDSYFDKTITKLTIPIAQARTTDELYQNTNYSNWDFDSIWDMENEKGYPTLRFVGSEPPKPNKPAAMIIIEKSDQLQLAVSEDLSENDELNWSSSEEAIATINNTGFVTAHTLGETLITAKSKNGKYEESIYIMVVDKAPEYRLTVELKTGSSCKVKIRGVDNSTIIWNSMDSATATVTEQGKVKAVSKGLTVLTAVGAGGKDVGQIYLRVR